MEKIDARIEALERQRQQVRERMHKDALALAHMLTTDTPDVTIALRASGVALAGNTLESLFLALHELRSVRD